MRLLFLVAPIIAASASLSVGSAAECQLTATTELLKKIETNPSIALCTSKTGISFNPPPSKPSTAQLDKICDASACRPAINFLVGLKMPSCTISMLNGVNLRQVTDTLATYCSKKSPVNVLGDNTAIIPASAPNATPAMATNAPAKPTSKPVPATKPATPKPTPAQSKPASRATPKPATTSPSSSSAPSPGAGSPKKNGHKNCQ